MRHLHQLQRHPLWRPTPRAAACATLMAACMIASTGASHVRLAAQPDTTVPKLQRAPSSPAAGAPCANSVCNIRDFGAVGDNSTLDTAAVQAALDACAAQPGGGTVLVPSPGVFMVGSVWLGNNTSLRIQDGAALTGVPPGWTANDTWLHYPRVYAPNTDGRQGWRHAGLINGGRCMKVSATPTAMGDQCLEWRTVRNVTITGERVFDRADGHVGAPVGAGIIDGVGWHWWRDCHNSASLCPDGGHDDYRPIMMHLMWTTGATITGVHLRNSAFWTVAPQYARDVEVRELTITAPASDSAEWPSHNTDGVDPQSSSNVLISGMHIDTGDDCVAVSAGKDLQGRLVGIPAHNVTVENSLFFHGHGASVGSGTAGNVSAVTFRNISMMGTGYGIRVKTQRGRGGLVSGIMFENMTLTAIEGNALQINMNYHAGLKPTNASATPHFANITIRDVVGTQLKVAGQIVGLPEAPVEGMTVDNVRLSAASATAADSADGSSFGFKCSYAHGTFSNVVPSLDGCLEPR